MAAFPPPQASSIFDVIPASFWIRYFLCFILTDERENVIPLQYLNKTFHKEWTEMMSYPATILSAAEMSRIVDTLIHRKQKNSAKITSKSYPEMAKTRTGKPMLTSPTIQPLLLKPLELEFLFHVIVFRPTAVRFEEMYRYFYGVALSTVTNRRRVVKAITRPLRLYLRNLLHKRSLHIEEESEIRKSFQVTCTLIADCLLYLLRLDSLQQSYQRLVEDIFTNEWDEYQTRRIESESSS
jgi:hypothetical protein